MSAARLEAFLAKIYVDEESRERFLADPRGEAAKAGLGEREIEALEKIDRAGLMLATQSLQKKRQRLAKTLFDRKNTKKKNTIITSMLRVLGFTSRSVL
jgi:hypothetical protein